MGTKHLNLPLRVTTHSDDRYGVADAAGNQVLPPQHVERAVMKTLVRACNAYPDLIALRTELQIVGVKICAALEAYPIASSVILNEALQEIEKALTAPTPS